MKNKIIIAVSAVVVLGAGIIIGSLVSNGAYHTNSNLAWRVTQAEQKGIEEGFNSAANQLFGEATQCGGAVVAWVASSSHGIECYQ